MHTFNETINSAIIYTQDLEDSHLRFLSKLGGTSTRWAPYQDGTNSGFFNDTKPGFFTPFNQKLVWNKTSGMKQAVIAASFVPTIKLVTVVAMVLVQPIVLLAGIKDLIMGQWGDAFDKSLIALSFAGIGIYFSGAFVLNFLKEVTALLTRSIATLVHMCKGSVCDNQDKSNSNDAVMNNNSASDPTGMNVEDYNLSFKIG